MTTPLNEEHDPERVPLDEERYPEFFAYDSYADVRADANARADEAPLSPTGTGRRRRSAAPADHDAGRAEADRAEADRVADPRPNDQDAPLRSRSATQPTPPTRRRAAAPPQPTSPDGPAPRRAIASFESPSVGEPVRRRAIAPPQPTSVEEPARGRAATPAQHTNQPALAALPPAATQGQGRRRAKRAVSSYLWPFRAASVPRSSRIRSRSTAATVWRRLKTDRLAVVGGFTIIVLIALAVFAPLISGVLGVDPNTPHYALTDPTFGPHGSFGGMTAHHPLGVDFSFGRDILSRLLYGARVSLLVAVAATILSVSIGAFMGTLAGYLGGRADQIITRIMDLFLAFPLLLFALGLSGALTDKAFGLSGNSLRIAILIFVIGFFNWPYIARMVRGEVLSLREREFIDAARSLGAGPRWIINRELLPNLLSPILVYATLLIPTNIIFEAAFSYLGIGVNPPTASWGQMLFDASTHVSTDPAYLIVPGMAVFITVLAFNLFGDGLRDALDPTA
jgi:ABC-type dipeptide/oligopeptide/nickel transport system permease subunit